MRCPSVGCDLTGREVEISVIEQTPKTRLRSPIMKPRCYVCRILLAGALVIGISGCGKGGDEPTASKTPATVEQASTIIDLSTFPVMDGAQRRAPGVASFSCEAPGDVKSVFEFQRKKLLALGFKELPNSSITDQAASVMFGKDGFILSVSVFPQEPNKVLVSIQNHGNIRPGKLPVPPNVKPVYVGDSTAMYVTDAAVADTKDACRKLLLADGWVPYGSAGDSSYYKQNAMRIEATVSSAPAQGGKTMISYLGLLMSADLPAPSDAEELRYTEQTHELSFETTADQKSIVDFYKKILGQAKWAPTIDHTVEIDGKQEMIFRNPTKDMLTLAMPPARGGKQSVSLQHQSAAEVAELDRQLKEREPEIRAKAKKQQEEEEAQWKAENAARAAAGSPKFAVTLPAGLTRLQASASEIKFNVPKGKAKAVVEAWRKEFRDAGWKEDATSVEALAGAVSLSKGSQSLSINYTDTGVLPAEVSLSAIGVELEARR